MPTCERRTFRHRTHPPTHERTHQRTNAQHGRPHTQHAYKHPQTLSLSLSLSLTHTHKHKHSLLAKVAIQGDTALLACCAHAHARARARARRPTSLCRRRRLSRSNSLKRLFMVLRRPSSLCRRRRRSCSTFSFSSAPESTPPSSPPSPVRPRPSRPSHGLVTSLSCHVPIMSFSRSYKSVRDCYVFCNFSSRAMSSVEFLHVPSSRSTSPSSFPPTPTHIRTPRPTFALSFSPVSTPTPPLSTPTPPLLSTPVPVALRSSSPIRVLGARPLSRAVTSFCHAIRPLPYRRGVGPLTGVSLERGLVGFPSLPSQAAPDGALGRHVTLPRAPPACLAYARHVPRHIPSTSLGGWT